ncbi:hypothetical protein ZHAWSFBX_CDS_0004 [Agrobacterium phage Alfirin]|nr:hypothetical protein ZHAWSFBX_CDS_0004 [Agrobacterium phage Alfirin]
MGQHARQEPKLLTDVLSGFPHRSYDRAVASGTGG